MTKEQFSNLIQSPTIINLNLVAELEDITTRFPYFQNAHLLLAKQYHGHENIRYESYLRKASAYAPDRVRLYHLIKETPAGIIHINEAVNINAPIRKEEKPIPDITTSEAVIEKSEKADLTKVTTIKKEVEVNDDVEIVESSRVEQKEKVEIPEVEKSDPRQVIEQRLKEIQGENVTNEEYVKEELPIIPPVSEEIKIEESSVDEDMKTGDKDYFIEPVSKDEQEEIPETSTTIPEVKIPFKDTGEKSISSSEHQSPAETTIPGEVRESDKGSGEEIAVTKTVPLPEKHSFAEWLKIKNVPVAGPASGSNFASYSIDEYNQGSGAAYDEDGNLLDRFIKTEPRIVQARSEFYSPGNMARKSAIEHEDLITETLARIYAQQGNIRKAIEAYERLSLKLPEKSSYFAALIRELQEKES